MFAQIDSLSKSFAGRQVFSDVSFGFEKGEFISIIGPSGVGKTTFLRILASLEAPSSGHIQLQTPPGEKHPVLMVFQDYMLFPTMSVRENIGFGLRARKWSKQKTAAEVDQFLRYFSLESRSDAYPSQLSGGEKQRVAIARALILSPSLLLLDEPFANLDQNLKMETAAFLRKIQQDLGLTVVAVTHDLAEAFFMSDRIGILLDGKLQQFDSPRNIYQSPSNLEVGRFMGPVNFLQGPAALAMGLPENSFLRAEQILMEHSLEAPGTIVEINFLGNLVEYCVRAWDQVLQVHSLDSHFRLGDRVSLRSRQLPGSSKEPAINSN